MLYLPPKYAHDGIALGECMTYSIGFRSPSRGEIAQELLQRIADQAQDTAGSTLYKDPRQEAVESPAEIPAGMLFFAQDAMARALNDPLIMARALGEYLTEPKADVWFESAGAPATEHPGALQLDRKTKMMFDASHIFINGESFLASGKDAKIMRQLANDRVLQGGAFDTLSAQAQELLLDWQDAGWIQ
jgi:50S ribosomal protein L16 3-hydroxylase